MDQLHGMSGPDFLDAVADQEAGNCNDVNAAYFRAHAAQWKRDQRDRDEALARASDLQDRLEHIAEHARVSTGAITPTDKR